MEPIPAGTQVKAAIDEVKFDSWEGDEYISARWTVLAPAEYKNRKVFQKLRVQDANSKKADKAKRMLAAIAVNAGGGLLKVADPNDADLQKHLMMKPMALKLDVWEINGNSGNWVMAVAPLKKKEDATPEPQPEPVNDDDDDGELPF
jgi:hypothetical protein